MTTTNEARAAVYQRIIDGWTATDLATAVAFDNDPFVPPDATDDGRESPSWVRFSVRHLDSQVHTFGTLRAQRQALLIAQIFTVPGQRMADLDRIAAAVRSMFELVSFEGVDTRSMRVQEIGLDDDGRWFQMNVSVPFVYYETR